MRAIRLGTDPRGPCARPPPVASENTPAPEPVLDPFDPQHLQRQHVAFRAQRRASRRRGLVIGAVAAFALIVAGGATWALLGGSSGSSSSARTTTTAGARRSRPITGSADSAARAIAAYRAAPLLQPTEIPVGWKPVGAQVIPKAKSVSGCDEVLVRYGSGDASDVNYLDVYLFPAPCDSHRSADARDVQIGTNPGWLSDRDPTLSVLAEVDVGTTKVQAETDLDTPAALAVLARLSKLDLAHPPAGLMPLTSPSTTAVPSTSG